MDKTLTKNQMANEITDRLKTAKPAIRPTHKQLMNMDKQELTRWYKKAHVVKKTIKGLEYKGDIAIR